MAEEHPLRRAIRLKRAAIKNKAHPKIIARLYEQVERQAAITRESLGGLKLEGMGGLTLWEMHQQGKKLPTGDFLDHNNAMIGDDQ